MSEMIGVAHDFCRVLSRGIHGPSCGEDLPAVSPHGFADVGGLFGSGARTWQLVVLAADSHADLPGSLVGTFSCAQQAYLFRPSFLVVFCLLENDWGHAHR